MPTSCAASTRAVGARRLELRGGRHQARALAEGQVRRAARVLQPPARTRRRARRRCTMHVVLGDRSERSLRCADYMHYFRALLGALHGAGRAVPAVPRAAGDLPGALRALRPVPLARALRGAARGRRPPVPGGRHHPRSDRAKLQRRRHRPRWSGSAALPADAAVPKMQPTRWPSCDRRRRCRRTRGAPASASVEVLPLDAEGAARLPSPARSPTPATCSSTWKATRSRKAASSTCSASATAKTASWRFRAFWAHDARRGAHGVRSSSSTSSSSGAPRIPARTSTTTPSYEETALKRLASLHATREVEVDNLLRDGVLVDLYKVVREGIRISEPSYSIKSVEHFYRRRAKARCRPRAPASSATSAGARPARRSCCTTSRTTTATTSNRHRQLRDWLLTLRPRGLPWAVTA